jgi:hypothetical protein
MVIYGLILNVKNFSKATFEHFVEENVSEKV